MCVDSDLCKGDLGIPRRLMPQFNSEKDIKNFVTFAEKRYGIKSRKATRRAGALRPSQEEINRERVEDVADDIRYKKLDPKVPLIVSKDGYVIDGHHRWAAFKKDKPTYKMPVLLVEAPARDVLSVAATWGARHQQF
jgi:ParB-like chromosome segregation protein Spo0J